VPSSQGWGTRAAAPAADRQPIVVSERFLIVDGFYRKSRCENAIVQMFPSERCHHNSTDTRLRGFCVQQVRVASGASKQHPSRAAGLCLDMPSASPFSYRSEASHSDGQPSPHRGALAALGQEQVRHPLIRFAISLQGSVISKVFPFCFCAEGALTVSRHGPAIDARTRVFCMDIGISVHIRRNLHVHP